MAQEVKKKKLHVGPTQIKKRIRRREEADGHSSVGRKFLLLLFFFSRFSLRYTEIGPSQFVGARTKRLYSTRATHENQKHGISPIF